MIRAIDALGYRALKRVHQPLGLHNLLVGEPGAGRGSFLDVLAFMRDLLVLGLDQAVARRCRKPSLLCWQGKSERFELGVEFVVPTAIRRLAGGAIYDTARYEISVAPGDGREPPQLLEERVVVLARDKGNQLQGVLFPELSTSLDTVLSYIPTRGLRTIIRKVPGGHDNYYVETGASWDHSFRLGPLKSALANLPDDEASFPVCTWIRRMLTSGIHKVQLLRAPLPAQAHGQCGAKGAQSSLAIQVLRLANERPKKLDMIVSKLSRNGVDLRGLEVRGADRDGAGELYWHGTEGCSVPESLVSKDWLGLLAVALVAAEGCEGQVFILEQPIACGTGACPGLAVDLVGDSAAQWLAKWPAACVAPSSGGLRWLHFARGGDSGTEISCELPNE